VYTAVPLTPSERDAIWAKALEQLIKLTRDDKTFLRSLHISPE
jgi:hypothetical protein